MGGNEVRSGAGFHELPLVLFTGMALAGAGIGSAQLGLSLLGWIPLVPARWVMALLCGSVACGLLFSMGHLGRPFRGVRALGRLGRSPLSNEVLVVGVVLATGLSSLTLPPSHPLVAPLILIALVSSVLTLIAVGQVYRLPGQLTWTGPVLVQPLTVALAFGLTVLLGTIPDGTKARGEILVLLFLLVDGLLVWDRTRRISAVHLKGSPAHPRLFRQRGAAVSLRTLTGVLIPAAALLWGWWELAVASLFINLFLDRFLFYGFAVRRGTEAEIMKVEAVLFHSHFPPS